MTTKMRTSAIALLLVLSLVVLVAAAAADGVDRAIRLPSDVDGKGDGEAAASLVGDKERPWKCCDRPLCIKSFPPMCRCMDTVSKCAAACKNCAKFTSLSGHICTDTYFGWPGPACTRPAAADVVQVQVMSTAPETETETEEELEVAPERPWECCDNALCTRSIPPRCRCRDTVDQCAAACKRCEAAPSSPAGKHVCMDVFKGWAGPTCAKRAAADAVLFQASTAVEERPWACCTKAVCTRSFPPICRCRDRVEECHPACQACRQVAMGPDRYICQDSYKGQPGPAC